MHENMHGRMELTGRPSWLFNTLGKFPSAVYAKGKQVILLPGSTPPHPALLSRSGRSRHSLAQVWPSGVSKATYSAFCVTAPWTYVFLCFLFNLWTPQKNNTVVQRAKWIIPKSMTIPTGIMNIRYFQNQDKARTAGEIL